jgi:hypothetical protein
MQSHDLLIIQFVYVHMKVDPTSLFQARPVVANRVGLMNSAFYLATSADALPSSPTGRQPISMSLIIMHAESQRLESESLVGAKPYFLYQRL